MRKGSCPKGVIRLAVAVLVLGCGSLAVWVLYRSGSSVPAVQSASEVIAGSNARENEPTFLVRRENLNKTLLLGGELRAVRFRSFFCFTWEETKITYLPPEGSLVRPGEKLVELDSGAVLTRIKDAREKILAAENEMVKTKSAQEAALREMEIELSRLWLTLEQSRIKARAPAELIARREYQDNQLALDKARTEYENQQDKIAKKKKEFASEQNVKAMEKQKVEVQLQLANQSMESMTIRAPFEGMVIYGDHWQERRKLQVGDVVWGGIPLVLLPDLREMEVLAEVSETEGPRIAVGQKATVRLDAYPEVEIPGSVREISQTAVKAGGMDKVKIFKAYITLDRTVTEIMKPGMSAQVGLVAEETGSELTVPRSAVRWEGDTASVLRLEGEGRLRPVAVTVLFSDPKRFAVAGNGALREGDRILANGHGLPGGRLE